MTIGRLEQIVLIISMLVRSLRRLFSFAPERSSRFFTLSLQLKPDIPLSETLTMEHEKQVKAAEQRGEILLATKVKERAQFEYLFQSPNELQPFYFVKQSPFFTHGMVLNYLISEVEMQLKVKDKELAPAYLRE